MLKSRTSVGETDIHVGKFYQSDGCSRQLLSPRRCSLHKNHIVTPPTSHDWSLTLSEAPSPHNSILYFRMLRDNYLTHLYISPGAPQHTNIIKYGFVPVHLSYVCLIHSPNHVPPSLPGWNTVSSLEHWGSSVTCLQVIEMSCLMLTTKEQGFQ